MDADIVVNSTITIPATVNSKLDLNGHNLKSNGWIFENKGTLTVLDSAGSGIATVENFNINITGTEVSDFNNPVFVVCQ